MIPWAKANLNYTAQALIISAGMLTIPVKQNFSSLPVLLLYISKAAENLWTIYMPKCFKNYIHNHILKKVYIKLHDHWKGQPGFYILGLYSSVEVYTTVIVAGLFWMSNIQHDRYEPTFSCWNTRKSLLLEKSWNIIKFMLYSWMIYV